MPVPTGLPDPLSSWQWVTLVSHLRERPLLPLVAERCPIVAATSQRDCAVVCDELPSQRARPLVHRSVDGHDGCPSCGKARDEHVDHGARVVPRIVGTDAQVADGGHEARVWWGCSALAGRAAGVNV
jgi:hypothetical protein